MQINTRVSHDMQVARLAGLELRAELARDHAAGLVDLHDPRAAHEVEVVVHRALDARDVSTPLLQSGCAFLGLAYLFTRMLTEADAEDVRAERFESGSDAPVGQP